MQFSRIYRKYHRWDEALQEAVDQRKPLRTLGLLSEPVFSNPLFLLDASFKEIFSIINKKRYPVSSEYLNTYVRDDYHYLDTDHIASLRSNETFREAFLEKEPVLVSSGHPPMNSIHYNIRMGEMPIAWLCVDELGRRLCPGDFARIVHLGKYIRKAIASHHMEDFNCPESLNAAVTEILDGGSPSGVNLQLALAQFGWSEEDSYFCLAAMPALPQSGPEALMALAVQAADISAGDFFLPYNGMAVFLFNLTKRQLSRQELIAAAEPVLIKSGFLAGVSLPFSGIRELSLAYRQCLTLLETTDGSAAEGGCGCLLFEDHALSYAVNIIRNDPLSGMLVPAGLRNLLSYDRDHGTKYTRCLRVFLENSMNIARTVADLYIHRNTFLYRLERIKKLLDMDLDDPDVRLLLLLSYRILDGTG